ncbi:MAG: hypothetical protein ACTSRR_10955 [Candidatus Heimdallarchaeaceae archaeon]
MKKENLDLQLTNLFLELEKKVDEFNKETIDSKEILTYFKKYYFEFYTSFSSKFSYKKLKAKKEKLRMNTTFTRGEKKYLDSLSMLNQCLIKIISKNQQKIVTLQYFDPKIESLEKLTENFATQKEESNEVISVLRTLTDWFLKNREYFNSLNSEKTELIIRKLLSTSNILSKVSTQIDLQLERIKFQDYLENLKSRREEILKKIIYEREKIPLQELSPLLEFNDVLELERWILHLPTKLFKIDDEIVIINKDEQDSDIVSAISMLLDKFQEYEELGLGKKI